MHFSESRYDYSIARECCGGELSRRDGNACHPQHYKVKVPCPKECVGR